MQENYFKQINVKTKKPYDVILGNNLESYLADFLKNKRSLVVTDSNVYKLYKDKMSDFFKGSAIFYFRAGEKSKNYRTLHKIYDFLIDNSADRYTHLIALGGGVVGDVTAFAASSYMRGIPLIHMPTTLLADCDSSIGGKTAINYGHFKNIIGSFYQPKLVVTDINFLHTLKKREFLSAIAEIVKYGIIMDEELFDYMEKNVEQIKNRDKKCIYHIIEKSIENKVKVVEEDEFESSGQRAMLNFGHTLAHAIESITDYKKYLHGEAVAIGSVFSAKLSYNLGLCSKSTYDRIEGIFSRFSLPTNIEDDFDSNDIYAIMHKDKKNKDGILRFVLTKKIGSSIILGDLDNKEVIKTINEFKR